MRRIYRGTIPQSSRVAMTRRANQCTDATGAKEQWNAFRPLAPCRPVINELTRMAGTRNRCFYCSDSRAADVDHYVPIAVDYRRAFSWNNLLWVCPECNRRKSARFPMKDGQPQLIDPTRRDPWQHFTLATQTGWVAPRFHDNIEDILGRETLAVLDTLNFEVVAEGRAEVIHRLRSAAEVAAVAPDRAGSAPDLWREVRYDERGVSAWFALWDGQREDPFDSIKRSRPVIWRHFVRAVAAK
jgi:5-methylcytosine-specific restriction endonuclease McrA